jgi:hypothetical protein
VNISGCFLRSIHPTVEVLQRPFVVTEVQLGALPTDYLNGRSSAQHLVTLTSVEDDALGESLQVIWEIEPGAKVFQKSELPEITAFDDPVRLDAFLDAPRWGAISSADHLDIQSPLRMRQLHILKLPTLNKLQELLLNASWHCSSTN